MRNLIRLLAAGLFCAALFTAVFVGAQDATPTPEATVEATNEATVEATVETTAEATGEATGEATVEATSETTAAPTSAATITTTPVPGTATATLIPAATAARRVNANGQPICDSNLILDLYIAEHFFGFDGVMSAAMNNTTNPMTPVDVTQLDKGQYAALFAAPITTVPPTVLTEEQIQSAASMMTLDDSTFMNQMATMMPPGTDMTGVTTLTSAAVAGEEPACADLRHDLDRFFTIVAFQSLMTPTPEATAAVGTTMNLSATLLGANEVPGPGDTDATGMSAVTLDMANSQVCYNIAIQNITLPATMAHIHRGAAGVKGDVVIPFSVAPDASGNATGCDKADPALLQEIASNPSGFYVNVHNADFPDGAARGQLAG